jgi:hypothetical protein
LNRPADRSIPLDRLDLSARLDSALAFLSEQQQPNGEFPTFKARDAVLAQERQFDSTPFATTYVLHALSYVERPRVREMTEAALDFLEAEMESHGVWRYWTSQHPQHNFIPPDLDDTCCAAAALRRFGRWLPQNEELILANRNREGLFYTWLVPHLPRALCRAWWSVTLPQAPLSRQRLNFWRLTEASPWDVDCVVNANVLHYLGDRAEVRTVVHHLARALDRGQAGSCDKWHRNACAFYYAVSRAYAGGVAALESMRKPLINHAEAALTRIEELATAEVALAICALLNLGHRGAGLDTGVAHLAATQGPDGSWPGFALYWGGPKHYYGWGSEALTTGLCAEALARFMPESAPPPQ